MDLAPILNASLHFKLGTVRLGVPGATPSILDQILMKGSFNDGFSV